MTDFNTLLADIMADMTDTSLTEPFYKMVLYRLLSLGYEPTDEDVWPLCFAMQKKETHVKNFCNISEVPASAYTILCDMVCGEFLSGLFQLNKLTGFDVDKAVKTMSMGDTSVTFMDSDSGESKVKALFDALLHGGEGDLICYRKLKW